MKKNKMMRLASSLMVAVLLTTSVISGTFAKYVTTDSAQDSARVAKWGVAVSVNGNLFGKDYAANSASENNDSIVAATSQSVHSEGEEDGIANIVAPGTKNDKGLKISLTGTPEVAYEISATKNDVEAEEIFLAEGNWGVMVPTNGLNDATDFSGKNYYTLNTDTYTVATSFDKDETYFELIDKAVVPTGGYYPIDWAVANTPAASSAFFNTISATRLNAIQSAMITDLTKGNVSANTPTNGSYVLTWKWDFNNGNDGADTILGNLMANNGIAVVVKANGDKYSKALTDGTDYNLENKFGISVTVTQVD